MQPDRILKFSKLLSNETITAAAAGTDVALTPRKVIAISVDAKCFITFNDSGTDAAATDFLLPAAGIYTFDTGNWTTLSIFAHSGGNVISAVLEMGN
jgi:hypothetical protein